jgi:signal transduction histidine kinase
MKPRWYSTLTGQLVALMLLALLVSFATTLVLSHGEKQRALLLIRRDDCISRTASIASLLLNTPDELHADVLRSVNSPFNRYWVTTGAEIESLPWQQTARGHLLEVRTRLVNTGSGGEAVGEPRPIFTEAGLPVEERTWESVTTTQRAIRFDGQFILLPAWNGMGMVLRVADGVYLNAVSAKPRELEEGNSALYASFAISAIMISLASVLAARRMGRPMRKLAEAAERLGRGEDMGEVSEKGADEIHNTAVALNRMQSRIRRFVEDRTNMIAAISHDLRTPITSLRLRAEFIQDTETREKIIATLQELQAMADATLEFAREESISESTRVVDLASLGASVCDDLAEIGWNVKFEDSGRVPVRCRPEAIRRALRNVIENATRYGTSATVRVVTNDECVDLVVEDDGPGIPESDHERVFKPFVRLESSRSRETGGVGLGLAITRTIIHAHGGEVKLANRQPHGLAVSLRLPRDTHAAC